MAVFISPGPAVEGTGVTGLNAQACVTCSDPVRLPYGRFTCPSAAELFRSNGRARHALNL